MTINNLNPVNFTTNKHFKLVAFLLMVVILMFVFGFALVPIYNSICKTLGINGKITGQAAPYTHGLVALDREITVEFVANQTSSMPWLFYPKVKKIKIHPGEVAKLAFYAENQTNKRMTVQAIPSVTPGIAAKYIKKTECFCFTQQTLNGHEGMEMPLLFHLDLDLPAKVKTLTLSYTLFDVTSRVN
jgi:cytochrome c oxidase assembly protein subunit 11